MIDRYLLRYFLAVIDCGSFSKAARQANVAQPTLSIGIAKLERLLGAVVFHRTSKRVQLTEAGSRFAAHARRIESEFNLAQAEILGLEPRRVLRLGVLATVPMAQIAEIIPAARGRGEIERLQIVSGNERETLQRLSRGQIDAAVSILGPSSRRFAVEPLYTERYLLAVAAGHRLAQKATIAAEELADETMIVRRHCEILAETSRHFTERGVRPFLSFRSTNDEQVLCLVQAGLGITVMPACYRATGILRPALTGFQLRRTIGILYAEHVEAGQYADSPLLAELRSRYADKREVSASPTPRKVTPPKLASKTRMQSM
jgi:DNA-binding transcriptional LysR family regulator